MTEKGGADDSILFDSNYELSGGSRKNGGGRCATAHGVAGKVHINSIRASQPGRASLMSYQDV